MTIWTQNNIRHVPFAICFFACVVMSYIMYEFSGITELLFFSLAAFTNLILSFNENNNLRWWNFAAFIGIMIIAFLIQYKNIIP